MHHKLKVKIKLLVDACMEVVGLEFVVAAYFESFSYREVLGILVEKLELVAAVWAFTFASQ